MGCCGEKIKNIATGYTGLVMEKLFHITMSKCEATDDRTRICHSCEKHTWLTKVAYVNFIIKHLGGVIMNFEDLSRLPELPKEENGPNKKLFCMLCKCFIPAKARVKEEKCSKGKW